MRTKSGPSRSFEFCRVCRRNHDQGRGHRYSVKHKQLLQLLLQKIDKKIEDSRFFLENVAPISQDKAATHDDRNKNFWCHFCEQDIVEQDSAFVRGQTIRHLGSHNHKENVKIFFVESGADARKQHLYAFEGDDLAKWEQVCKAMSEPPVWVNGTQNDNNIHPDQCVSDATSTAVLKNSAFHASSFAVKPSSVLTNFSFQDNGKGTGIDQKWLFPNTPGKELSGSCNSPPPPPPPSKVGNPKSRAGLEQAKQHLSGGWGQDLTSIRVPGLDPGEGNVYSGAVPPWLKQDMGKEDGLFNGPCSSGSQGLHLSRTQERKLAKIRNPNRVGAAWAEMRRAELEREQRGEIVDRSVKEQPTWFPSFGRVWQSGSRRDTRKEFEAEKHSDRRREGRKKRLASTNTELKPYVSKQQRMAMDAAQT